MEYDVVSEDNLGSLIEEVNKKLAEGWKPLGGIKIRDLEWENERKGYTERETIYYQAVAREAAV